MSRVSDARLAEMIDHPVPIGPLNEFHRLALDLRDARAELRVSGEAFSTVQDDLRDLLDALGLFSGARPQSPHEVMREALDTAARHRTEAMVQRGFKQEYIKTIHRLEAELARWEAEVKAIARRLVHNVTPRDEIAAEDLRQLRVALDQLGLPAQGSRWAYR